MSGIDRAPVLVTFAVREEAQPFRKQSSNLLPVRILVTGMGAKQATKSFLDAIQASPPSAVLTCGFAGGLNPALQHGTVVFDASEEFVMTSNLKAAGAVPGRFLCLNRVIVRAEEKRKLHQETGADAVEMESGAIRAACDQRGIPSATVRVISDAAGEDMPLDFNQLLNDRMQLDLTRLALAVARSPEKIAALWRFNGQIRAAANRLAEVLTHVLS